VHNKLAALPLFFVAAAAFAQVSEKPVDAVIPVVGSTHGQSNAFFKTELQLHNASDASAAGWLILHPQETLLRYDLPARATIAYDDVVAAMGSTGLGSLDILVDRGELPEAVARAYDDQPDGTTGATVPRVRNTEALVVGSSATLIAPRDFTRYRFNLGIRTLESGATIEFVVRDASGTERFRRMRAFAAVAFEQNPVDVFLGTTLQATDSIEVNVLGGNAVVYGSMIDNATNDSSLQVPRR